MTQAGSLPLPGLAVIMVENLRNFLALPPSRGVVALFGAGDALANWRGVEWLQSTECHYWGDLDIHGFAMLARFRSFVPLARSLLMDKNTLDLHRVLGVVDETRNPGFDASLLHPNEIDVLSSLIDEKIRLEQERIPMDHVCREIERARAVSFAQSSESTQTV